MLWYLYEKYFGNVKCIWSIVSISCVFGGGGGSGGIR